MAEPLIRFSCHCGKRLAAPAKYAGREGRCTKCGEAVTVPTPKPTAASRTPVPKPMKRCENPTLDRIYQMLTKQLAERIDEHDVIDNEPVLQFVIPEDRSQKIHLSVDQDQQGREWLVVRSEIGTITTLDEMKVALELNRALQTSRLYLDYYQVLQLESRCQLDEMGDTDVQRAVEEVADWAN